MWRRPIVEAPGQLLNPVLYTLLANLHQRMSTQRRVHSRGSEYRYKIQFALL